MTDNHYIQYMSKKGIFNIIHATNYTNNQRLAPLCVCASSCTTLTGIGHQRCQVRGDSWYEYVWLAVCCGDVCAEIIQNFSSHAEINFRQKVTTLRIIM